jgi:hypothetical protein
MTAIEETPATQAPAPDDQTNEGLAPPPVMVNPDHFGPCDSYLMHLDFVVVEPIDNVEPLCKAQIRNYGKNSLKGCFAQALMDLDRDTVLMKPPKDRIIEITITDSYADVPLIREEIAWINTSMKALRGRVWLVVKLCLT